MAIHPRPVLIIGHRHYHYCIPAIPSARKSYWNESVCACMFTSFYKHPFTLRLPRHRLNAVIDSLIRYTFETGLLTWYVILAWYRYLALLKRSSVREPSSLASLCVNHNILQSWMFIMIPSGGLQVTTSSSWGFSLWSLNVRHCLQFCVGCSWHPRCIVYANSLLVT